MNYLLIFDSSIAFERLRFQGLSSDSTVYLFSLTSLSHTVDKLKSTLSDRGFKIEEIDTVSLLNKKTDEIKAKYINFIAELPEKVTVNGENLRNWFAIDETTSLWWLSLVAEKNTVKSDSFQNLVQLDSIISVIKEQMVKGILFGCGSKKLKTATGDYSKECSIEFRCLPTKEMRSRKERMMALQKLFYLKHFLLLLFFAISRFRKGQRIRKKLGKIRRKQENKKFMIVTYYPNIDMSSAQQGVFKNQFYPYLQKNLESEGDSLVWVLLSVDNNAISFDESLKFAEQFIMKGYRLFFYEEFDSYYIQIKTLFRIFLIGLKFLKSEKNIRGKYKFRDYSFYSIFRDEWYSSFTGFVGYEGLLYYSLFKAMLKELDVEKCLYYCEQHAWEKALICARNSVNSRIKLYGYQHSTVPPMLLNYFNDPREISRIGRDYAMPTPNWLLCNGNRTTNQMINCGWPEDRVKIVEAIRLDHLKKVIEESFTNKKDIILYVSSINRVECGAILNVINEAFYDEKEINMGEIWVRFHPFLNIKRTLEQAKLKENALSFKIKREKLEDLLPEVKVVIVGETSAALEALAFGAKVIIINVPELIDMSPLREVNSDLIERVSSVEELRIKANEFIKEEYDPDKHTLEAKNIISDFFCFSEDSCIPHRFIKTLTA